MAVAYGALGEHQKKLIMLGKALPIFRAAYGDKHQQVAMTLTNMAPPGPPQPAKCSGGTVGEVVSGASL